MVALCICCWKKSNGVIPSSLSYYSANAFYSMGKRWGRWEKKPIILHFPYATLFFFSLTHSTSFRFISASPLWAQICSDHHHCRLENGLPGVQVTPQFKHCQSAHFDSLLSSPLPLHAPRTHLPLCPLFHYSSSCSHTVNEAYQMVALC